MDEQQIAAALSGEDEQGERAKEPAYVMPPHPEASAPLSKEAVTPGEPTAPEESIADLIQQAVDELRFELREELETQANRIQSELQGELQSELRKVTGGELNAKG